MGKRKGREKVVEEVREESSGESEGVAVVAAPVEVNGSDNTQDNTQEVTMENSDSVDVAVTDGSSVEVASEGVADAVAAEEAVLREKLRQINARKRAAQLAAEAGPALAAWEEGLAAYNEHTLAARNAHEALAGLQAALPAKFRATTTIPRLGTLSAEGQRQRRTQNSSGPRVERGTNDPLIRAFVAGLDTGAAVTAKLIAANTPVKLGSCANTLRALVDEGVIRVAGPKQGYIKL